MLLFFKQIHCHIKTTNDFSCLAKAKSHELFYIWVTKLQAHRLYKKNEAAHVHSGFLQTFPHSSAAGQAQRNGDLVTVKQTIKSNVTEHSL